jgi:hypothetical protein
MSDAIQEAMFRTTLKWCQQGEKALFEFMNRTGLQADEITLIQLKSGRCYPQWRIPSELLWKRITES